MNKENFKGKQKYKYIYKILPILVNSGKKDKYLSPGYLSFKISRKEDYRFRSPMGTNASHC